jgi:phage tail sheath protein FI
MGELRTPGVHVERRDPPAPVRPLRTDVAGFVGIAERGPLHRAVPIESWEAFRTIFGKFVEGAFLAYAVKAFFENGGRRVYVVRAAAESATCAEINAPATTGGVTSDRLRLVAASEGRWAHRVSVRIVRSVRATATLNVAAASTASSPFVSTTVGFARGALLEVRQGATIELAIVEDVDRGRSRLVLRSPLAIDLTLPAVFDVRVFSLSIAEDGKPVEHFGDLSLAAWTTPRERWPDDRVRVASEVLEGSRFLRVEEIGYDPTLLPDPTQRPLVLENGADGLAALRPSDLVGEPGATALRGLRALEPIDDVALVAIPDAMAKGEPIEHIERPEPGPPPCVPCEPARPELPPHRPDDRERAPGFSNDDILEIERALLLHAETLRDRFAILDAPREASPTDVLGWRSSLDSSFGALYYPWIDVHAPGDAPREPIVRVPPSGHVAGLVARVDLAAGVHTPPANQELRWAYGLAANVDDALAGVLNPAHVNAIRSFGARGLRVYGARTVGSDARYRYVNVRRLMSMIEEALEEALQWAVFEPHDRALREKILLVVGSFLEGLWRRGAIVGATADQAFFVRCDDAMNPPESVALGRIVVLAGVAPVVPAEFVVLRIGRTRDELEIIEQGASEWL